MYDPKYHLHIGYYKNNHDIECVAYKRQLEDVWDVFFDFEQYGFQSLDSENILSIEGYGQHIFSVYHKKIDYRLAAETFEQWLILQKLI